MGEILMKDEELEYIGSYVKDHLSEWLQDSVVQQSLAGLSLAQTERIIRVEEGIKHQGELLEKLLHQMDKRFEQVDKRFEQVDKRFEQVDKRFEQVDKRIEQLVGQMDKRFEQMDIRFKQMFAFVTTIFVVLGTMMSVYQFLS